MLLFAPVAVGSAIALPLLTLVAPAALHGQLYALSTPPSFWNDTNGTVTEMVSGWYQELEHVLYDVAVESPESSLVDAGAATMNFHPLPGMPRISSIASSPYTVAVIQDGNLYVFGNCSVGQAGVDPAYCAAHTNGTIDFPVTPRHPCDYRYPPPYSLNASVLDAHTGAVNLSAASARPAIATLVAVSTNHTAVLVGRACPELRCPVPFAVL